MCLEMLKKLLMIRQVVEMALGWHELLVWRKNEGWWVVCSKEKLQHYEKIYQRI